MKILIRKPAGFVYPGLNVSDRRNWKANYRCPDVAVYLADNPAENHESFMLGGPDLAIEIVSRGDRSREKLDFFAKTNTRELLILDRNPWQLELYTLNEGKLQITDVASATNGNVFQTKTIPLTWRFNPCDPRPELQVSSPDGQTWRI